jgi:formate dehydrogenase major subunit
MGMRGFDWQTPKEVFNELCSLSTIYRGLDWDLVGEGRFHWPVPEKGHPGTPVLHVGKFVRGRGLFKTPEYRDPAEVIDAEYPLWLTTGRRLAHYHTRTMTGRTVASEYLVPEELVEVHPEDVAAFGLEDGGLAVLASRRGEVLVKVQATDQSPRGTVFCSFSFSNVPINALTGSGYDPITDTAELKVCAVRIEAATAELGV